LRRPFPPMLAERLDGARIGELGRRGKYILIELDADGLLLLHLGMSGRVVAGGIELPEEKHDHVVLTLDDGYAENLTGLRAVAECEGVPVTICVCTRHVSDRSELAHDLTRSERGFASMGWSDVRFLDRHGVTIASHTRTHFNCGSGDYATLAAEIASSKSDLESELGHPIEVFAFPKGRPENISPLAHQIAVHNYPVVMSAAGGSNTGPLTFPMHLRRFSHPDSLLELELQLQEILDRPPSVIAMPPMVSPHADSPALGAGTS